MGLQGSPYTLNPIPSEHHCETTAESTLLHATMIEAPVIAKSDTKADNRTQLPCVAVHPESSSVTSLEELAESSSVTSLEELASNKACYIPV